MSCRFVNDETTAIDVDPKFISLVLSFRPTLLDMIQ